MNLKFWKKKASSGEGEESGEAPPTEGREPPSEENPAPRNLKKRLILSAALAASILLLSGIGFTVWKLFLAPEPHEPEAVTAQSPEPAQHAEKAQAKEEPPPPEPPAKTPDSAEMQAQIETLKKQNEQMQNELEAMRKARQEERKPSPAPAAKAPGGEVLFSGKDPKASAQALKQAIEEMNAASGYEKPRKPPE